MNEGNDQNKDSSQPPALPSRDVCGRVSPDEPPRAIATDQIDELEKHGASATKTSKYEDNCTYEGRLSTFDNWPVSLKLRPETLAEAGFFYVGRGDQTYCFHCGLGLHSWEDDDDPYEQHARWYPECTFLTMKKGKQFIEGIQKASSKEPSHLGDAEEQPPKGKQFPADDIPCTSFGKDYESSASSYVEKQKEDRQSSAPGCSKQTEESSSSSGSSQRTTLIPEGEKSVEETGCREDRLCKICKEKELCVVFLPCGHVVACEDCAADIYYCTVCNVRLKATVKAFLT